MYTKQIFAVGALVSAVAAVPMAKRDVVWVTETDEATVTVPVTQTVWVNPGESVPTQSHYGHNHPHRTTTVQSTVTAPAAPSAPAPAPSSAESSPSSAPEAPSTYEAPSSYVAPTTSTSIEVAPTTPSSTSVYVAPTPSSTYVAPTTTSPSEAAPTTPTSTWEPASTTSEAPAATTTASSSGDNTNTGVAAPGSEYTGDLTWYDVGMGACGITSVASDKIVAIAESVFDQYTPDGNPNHNTLCGKQVTITGVNGSPYTATIVDRCGGCKAEDLDLSQDFFNAVTNNGDGRVHNMSWKFD